MNAPQLYSHEQRRVEMMTDRVTYVVQNRATMRLSDADGSLNRYLRFTIERIIISEGNDC